ncbi:VOC family protein [Mucilaginibacter pallidiroseus]|uniref:VOC family protein n=1 Tax=Mucilaginibacter pallidiroseus TaxID=2599295 RepID=A0A563UES7_9SPHI|nr:VOC family protein [Mucilaginibacter pallidiroseus]TWR29783.1 VOC family protein [Mucilaginibacter pallidiroseus]
MSTISAYINFQNGECAEAMAFYKEILGGELYIQIVKDSPMKDMFPAETQEGVLHASLNGDGFSLLGSDMPDGNAEFTTGAVTLMITKNTVAEMQVTFDKLAEGGSITNPVMEFFAGTMGNLKDKFGVKWGVFTEERLSVKA